MYVRSINGHLFNYLFFLCPSFPIKYARHMSARTCIMYISQKYSYVVLIPVNIWYNLIIIATQLHFVIGSPKQIDAT